MVNDIKEVRVYFPSSVLPYEPTKNIFLDVNQKSLSEEGLVVLPTPQHVTKLEVAIEKANQSLELQRTGLKFIKHEKLNDYYIQIVDTNNEVIREIPSKKSLDFFAAFMEFNRLFDERV
ncbi:flagellar protein FlaG [Exiguobacterium mexicanum]|uniref:Flagellar protein FlaG n=1 Tax=Exiguobacterium mexicanum TaxID=340146 RepID=A0ABT7MN29_9BACL|nr:MULTISPECIES: flagellar protein FlaG [Exiguobacterium]MDL5376604.1 flagellar protein FlaG [Exiguobacterium mexicanum]